MTLSHNNTFLELVEYLKNTVALASQHPEESPEYKEFIAQYPANKISSLTLDEYCVGRQSKSFCWWLERGLESVLGRYMPGSARGHIVYYKSDGSIYKHNKLADLSDKDALQYTLKIQATIANADTTKDILWIDDNDVLYERAGVEPRVTIGEGRKLRLLSCYNPTTFLSIASSKHIEHFLQKLGCRDEEIPDYKRAVARSLLLSQYYHTAKNEIPSLTQRSFVDALYRSPLNLAPVKTASATETDDPVDVTDNDTTIIQGFLGTASAKNLILYGPPGTGKTYATINAALEILDPKLVQKYQNDFTDNARRALKTRFDELNSIGYISFVTFHQSFSYEDFVEGLRAETSDDGQLHYKVVDGVFKKLCNQAFIQKASSGPFVQDEVIGKYTIHRVSDDLVELKKPNGNLLPFSISLLKMLAEYVADGTITVDDIRQKNVFNKVEDTRLEPYLVNGYANILPLLVERVLEKSAATSSQASTELDQLPQNARVLIIDEINRGNVSRIFGELITLIEPSKRYGADEALEVTLPYSKTQLSVPSNVYIIGTMNTADRSLSGLDIALRRRFTFREMPPCPELLDEIIIQDKVDLGKLLRTLNQRIEALLDRDHCLGHTYFLPLKTNPSLSLLSAIFRHQIIPLLQEYFFEDWERIHLVLNDHRKKQQHQFVKKLSISTEELFGDIDGINQSNFLWSLHEDAFNEIDSYATIIAP